MWFSNAAEVANGGFPSLPLCSANTSSNRRVKMNRAKPPNILIYSGPPEAKPTSAVAHSLNALNNLRQTIQVNISDNVRRLVSSCMNKDAYIIYELTDSQALTSPWSENTALLINCCENVSHHVQEQFFKYFKDGGKLLSFGCAGLDSNFVNIETSIDTLDGEVSLHFDSDRSKPKKYQFNPIANHHYNCRFISYRSNINTATSGDNILTQVPFVSKTYFYQNHENSKIKSAIKCPVGNCAGIDVIVKVASSDEGVAVLTPLIMGHDFPLLKDEHDIVEASLRNAKSVHKQIMYDLLSQHLSINCLQQTIDILPTYGTMYCSTQNDKSSILTNISRKFTDRTVTSKTLHFKFTDDTTTDVLNAKDVDKKNGEEDKDSEPIVLPIYLTTKFDGKESEGDDDCEMFDARSYLSHLSSVRLGRCVLYFDVITSTMDVCDMLRQVVGAGVVVGAGRQVTGKGRGGNAWISPAGSLSMSLIFTFPLASTLGQHLPFTQHIIALAAVLAIRDTKSCDKLDIRIKWPNDVYYGRRVKIGGVLVTSSVQGNLVTCVAGIGLNVSNSIPTMCLNDIVRIHNRSCKQIAAPFTNAVLMAQVASQLEHLLHMYQNGRREEIMQLYYKYWLHTSARVSTSNGDEVIVRGLDELGFLMVQNEQGSQYSVQPDGNSYDMLHNLIQIKSSRS